MPIESGAIDPAPSQYPVHEESLQEEPLCFNAEPCQRPSSLRDLAYALQKHPAGNSVLEQIAQVCGATPGNIEILQEIEHYLSRPPWEMPGSLLGGGAVVGTGNVTGPTSSTDNAIARYDGTTGTEIQNSPIIIDDSGNMTGVVDLTASGAISANSASLTNPLPHTSGGTGLNADPSDGQLLVGNSSLGGYSLADLGAGTGILITIGPGSISIEAENNGDVVGPLSATDNAIARYDGATGKLIQDSAVLVDDSANVTGAGSILLTEQASAPLPVAAGEGMFWSKADAPTSPYFTDDIGDDHELMAGNNNLSEITNAATARSNIGAGTGNGDMLGSNNLSDLSSDDSSIVNLIGGATQEVPLGGSGPNLAGLLALRNSSALGRKIDLQYLYNAIVNLTAATPALSDKLAFHLASNGARSVTPQDLVALGVLPFEARLSPSSTLAVPTSDSSTVSTLYLHPFKGNRIALRTSTGVWRIYHLSTVSKALSGLTSGRPYDVFVYDNLGTITLEFVAWSSTTARATALTTQDGVYVKSGDATRRYVGTFHTTASNSTAWVTDGGTTVSAKLLIWNYYNRVRVRAKVRESTSTWSYNSATWRPFNNATDNRVEVVVGVAEDYLRMQALAEVATTGGAEYGRVGIGKNRTNGTDADFWTGNARTNANQSDSIANMWDQLLGYSYYQMVESTSGAVEFFGTNGAYYQCGIAGEVWA